MSKKKENMKIFLESFLKNEISPDGLVKIVVEMINEFVGMINDEARKESLTSHTKVFNS